MLYQIFVWISVNLHICCKCIYKYCSKYVYTHIQVLYSICLYEYVRIYSCTVFHCHQENRDFCPKKRARVVAKEPYFLSKRDLFLLVKETYVKVQETYFFISPRVLTGSPRVLTGCARVLTGCRKKLTRVFQCDNFLMVVKDCIVSNDQRMMIDAYACMCMCVRVCVRVCVCNAYP